MRGRRLTPDAVDRIDDWSARQGIECLYFLADAADPATAPLAEAAGFRLVDVRITLERRREPRTREGASAIDPAGASAIDPAGASAIDPASANAIDPAGASAIDPASANALGSTAAHGVEVRPAVAGDMAQLRRIAAASHHDSRFYQDPHFDRARAGELYAQWIERCCGDPAGIVLAAAPAAPAAGVLGYIAAAATPAGAGQISLFAVAAAARGQGLGGRLIAAALDWFAARGADPITVVTQGRNLRAQRIYQHFGLLSHGLELWFHRWHLRDDAAGAHPAWRRPRP